MRVCSVIVHSKVLYQSFNTHTCMKAWQKCDRFYTFLESTCKLQSTRSPKLPNGFWWFLVQNEAEVLLVLFLRFLYYFCLLKTGETFKRSLELGFFLASFEKNTNCSNWLRSLPWSIRLEIYKIHRHTQPRMNFSCSYSQKVVANQFLADLEPSSGMRFG